MKAKRKPGRKPSKTAESKVDYVTVSLDALEAFERAVKALQKSGSRDDQDALGVVNYDVLKDTLALGLEMIDPHRPYDPRLFGALCRLTTTVAVEAVAFQVNPCTGIVSVLLIQRAKDEPVDPGNWHCPGSAKRPGESDDDVINRLARSEFGLPGDELGRQYVDRWTNPNEARGHFEHIIYLVEVVKPANGAWFPVDLLPEETTPHHQTEIIPRALERLRKNLNLV